METIKAWRGRAALTALLALLLLLLLPISPGTSAIAGGGKESAVPAPPLTAEEREAALAGDAVKAVAARVDGYVQAHPKEGYGGLRVNPSAANVEIWWHGQVPAEIKLIADDSSDDVTVEILAADYRRIDLVAAIEKLLDDSLSPTGVLPKAGIEIKGGAPAVDASGLDLNFLAPTLPGDASTKVATVKRAVTTFDGYPVSSALEAAGPTPAVVRWDDSSPSGEELACEQVTISAPMPSLLTAR